MSPAAREAAAKKTQEVLTEMSLQKLRRNMKEVLVKDASNPKGRGDGVIFNQ